MKEMTKLYFVGTLWQETLFFFSSTGTVSPHGDAAWVMEHWIAIYLTIGNQRMCPESKGNIYMLTCMLMFEA